MQLQAFQFEVGFVPELSLPHNAGATHVVVDAGVDSGCGGACSRGQERPPWLIMMQVWYHPSNLSYLNCTVNTSTNETLRRHSDLTDSCKGKRESFEMSRAVIEATEVVVVTAMEG
ncbi:hypothetical protein ACLB2K_001893 [Fragaria x ananassa]